MTKTYKKRNVSIREFTKVETDEGRRSKHIVQLTPLTQGGGNLAKDYVPTALDDELTRLQQAGAKVLGFKRVDGGYAIKTMVPL